VIASGTLVFAPGITARTIPLVINGDWVNEGSEFFTVQLEGATGATLAVASGRVTILPPATMLSVPSMEATAAPLGESTPLVLRWNADETPDGLALRLAGAPADAPFLRWNRDEGTLAACRASVVPRGSAALPVLDCASGQPLGSPAGVSLGHGLRVQLAGSRFGQQADPTGAWSELTLILSDRAGAPDETVVLELARLGADGQLGRFSPLMPLKRPAPAGGTTR
jgi:hypothetical protein